MGDPSKLTNPGNRYEMILSMDEPEERTRALESRLDRLASIRTLPSHSSSNVLQVLTRMSWKRQKCRSTGSTVYWVDRLLDNERAQGGVIIADTGSTKEECASITRFS